MFFKWFVFFLYIGMCLSADPWGIDADIVRQQDRCEIVDSQKVRNTGPLQQLSIYMIRFYKTHISTANCKKSHFYPTSSIYTREAIEKYGFFKGWMMGFDRLMRENNDPWFYDTVEIDNKLVKWDPVK